MNVKELVFLGRALHELRGRKIRAFGPDSEGIWGRSEEVKWFVIKDFEVDGDSLNVVLDDTVYMDYDNYDPAKTGLIYTCTQFQRDLEAMFDEQGIKARISWSEQGRQGDTCVNFDFEYPVSRE